MVSNFFARFEVSSMITNVVQAAGETDPATQGT